MTITKLLSFQQAADYAGISRQTARRYLKREENPFPAFQMGKRNRFVIKEKLEEWIFNEMKRKAEKHGAR